jgi:SAM-dependent methyltransferase
MIGPSDLHQKRAFWKIAGCTTRHPGGVAPQFTRDPKTVEPVRTWYNAGMQEDAINEQTVEFVVSSSAQNILAELRPDDLRPERVLSTLTKLRRELSGEEAGALVALAQLRLRAIAKFPDADRLFFVAEALEQATAWDIANRRAAWMHTHLPPGRLLDLGCGIGGDMLAMARYRSVVGYENDPVRARLAVANAEALGLADRVQVRLADWTVDLANDQLPQAVGAFADPSRRVGERHFAQRRRVFSVHEMDPPLEVLTTLQARIPALGVKVMPGVNDDHLPQDCGVEFTGHAGACKEAVLWFGPLAVHRRWATIHAGGMWHEIVSEEIASEKAIALEIDTGSTGQPYSETVPGQDDEPGSAILPLTELSAGRILYEPHPAVIRAGAFAELSRQLNAQLIDPHIAYLLSSTLREHPLVQSFRLLEVHPFSLKLLNRRLQALGVGEIELKKRGFPMEPEQIRKRLKLTKGGRKAVLLIMRYDQSHIMILAERPEPDVG